MALALNNLQKLICHERKEPNQTKPKYKDKITKNMPIDRCSNSDRNEDSKCWLLEKAGKSSSFRPKFHFMPYKTKFSKCT